ncbi:MAG: glycosyltransferase family 2 protein [Candidatus Omnitrophota bacterium]
MVSVIVVAFAGENYIRKCLDSLTRQSCRYLDIIVVDNSAKPDIERLIQRSYPAVRLFVQEKNIFYGPALNIGIKQGSAEYILCLNDDVVLDDSFVEKALRGFSVDKKIGMVSGKILRSDRATIDSTGLFLSAWASPLERGYGKKDNGQFDKEGFIFGVSGAAAFYRRKMLDGIKEGGSYFDTDFAMFYEDLDIAWRALRAGWKGYYIPDAVAYHSRGASTRPDNTGKKFARLYIDDTLQMHLVKNRYLAIIKNISLSNLLLRLPFLAFYDFFLWVYILIFRPKAAKLFLANVNSLRNALRKRFSVGEKRKQTVAQAQKSLDTSG